MALLAQAGLDQVPVPVGDLLSERAMVQSANLPAGFDGILVRKRGLLPKVFVAENVPETRKRFTYSHELGHIMIPWHTGSILCQPGEYLDSVSPEAQLEREANDFASALLMPVDWLNRKLDVSPEDIVEAVVAYATEAQVSLAAAVRAFGRGSSQAAQVVLVDGHGVEASSRTPRWHGTNVGPWTPDPITALSALDVSVFSLALGKKTLFAAVHMAGISQARPERASTEILREFLTGTFPEPSGRNRMFSRINGVVGSANNRSSSRDAKELLSALTQRFSIQDYSEVLEDPMFREFLLAKAFELSGK